MVKSYLFIQLFRNRIARSGLLKNKIQSIESIIRSNLSMNEKCIVSKIVNQWSSQPIINLTPIFINRIRFDLCLNFDQLFTHGSPYLSVCDKVEVGKNDYIEYETEFGDIAIIVEYWMEDTLLSRKASILQTKKEKQPNQSYIHLHQLYLMQYWPSVKFKKSQFLFDGVIPEEFSFYHFILDKSRNPFFSSSIYSAPLVGALLGLKKKTLICELKRWIMLRKKKGKKNPPSRTLKGLCPGAIEGGNIKNKSSWRMVPKPFDRFLREAAYLFVGTHNDEVLELIKLRVPNVLYLRIIATRNIDDWLGMHSIPNRK